MVGQDEIVVLMERLPEEEVVPERHPRSSHFSLSSGCQRYIYIYIYVYIIFSW